MREGLPKDVFILLGSAFAAFTVFLVFAVMGRAAADIGKENEAGGNHRQQYKHPHVGSSFHLSAFSLIGRSYK
jgi:hypothetical protein